MYLKNSFSSLYHFIEYSLPSPRSKLQDKVAAWCKSMYLGMCTSVSFNPFVSAEIKRSRKINRLILMNFNIIQKNFLFFIHSFAGRIMGAGKIKDTYGFTNIGYKLGSLFSVFTIYLPSMIRNGS